MVFLAISQCDRAAIFNALGLNLAKPYPNTCSRSSW